MRALAHQMNATGPRWPLVLAAGGHSCSVPSPSRPASAGWCRPADGESGESGGPEVAGGFLSPLLGVMAAVIFWD